MQTRTCRHGGRLVPMTGWLPRSPLDRDVGALWGQVGCNQLQCSRCGQPVRWYDNACVPPGERRVGPELVAATDPFAAGLLIASPSGRMYACSCAIRQVFTAISVDGDYGLDPRVTEPGPWRCAGHPLPTLPWRIGGHTIERWDQDADALVVAYLAGHAPTRSPLAGSELEGVAGAWLVHVALLPDEGAFRDAVAAALAGRAGWHAPASVAALLTMALLPDQDVARRGVVDLARASADAGWSVTDDTERLRALVDALGVIGADDRGDADVKSAALTLARAAWLAGAPCRTLPHSLVRAGVRWLVDDARAAKAAQPKAFDDVLWLLEQRGDPMPVLDT